MLEQNRNLLRFFDSFSIIGQFSNHQFVQRPDNGQQQNYQRQETATNGNNVLTTG
jgi:hypothetical protein